MFRPIAGLTLGVLLLATGPVPAAEGVSLEVDLEGPEAADRWVLPPKGGAGVTGGELVLDTISRGGVRVFLREPVLSDLILTCKVCIEPKGPGVRAFEVCFHSAGIASHQYVHVNRSAAILCRANRDNSWNELARVGCRRTEGTWLDVRVECA